MKVSIEICALYIVNFLVLGVPSLCSSVFLLITNASCASELGTRAEASANEKRGAGKRTSVDSNGSAPNTPGPSLKLHASHVLSMEALMSVGLEIGSHCNDCWKFIFKYVLSSLVC